MPETEQDYAFPPLTEAAVARMRAGLDPLVDAHIDGRRTERARILRLLDGLRTDDGSGWDNALRELRQAIVAGDDG